MMDGHSDDAEWERWMALTDAEVEAEIAAVEAAYSAFYEALNPVERYRHNRRFVLGTLVIARKNARAFPFLRERLRATQNRLAELRRSRPKT